MGEITVHRKSYVRKDGTRVKASTFKVKDKGAKGRTPKSHQWAEFNTVTGWSKTQPSDIRHRKMLSTTNMKLSLHDRYVQAGRRLVQLANVTTDKPTEIKARADAHYFFRKAKEDWYGREKKVKVT